MREGEAPAEPATRAGSAGASPFRAGQSLPDRVSEASAFQTQAEVELHALGPGACGARLLLPLMLGAETQVAGAAQGHREAEIMLHAVAVQRVERGAGGPL